MKLQIFLFAVLLLNNSSLILGQTQAYVTADNGLTVREQPNPIARRIGKLNYGEAIEITETTTVNFALMDEGEKIEGQWVKIQTPTIAGYVFNGFLSDDKVAKPIVFRYDGIKIRLKNLKTLDEFKVNSFHDKDTIKISVALEDSPEGKLITIDNNGYKHISMFQRLENSVTILNEGPHCDLREWKHHYSPWRPLEAISKTKFRTLRYTPLERRQFMDIDIHELKAEVESKCGKDWTNYIKDIRTVNEFPADIAISRIFIKVLLTDLNDKIIEKIIEFEIPMGC